MKLKVISALALIVVLMIAAVLFYQKNRGFLYAGTIEATEVDLSSRLTGVIESMPAEEGVRVKQGDILVSIAAEDVAVSAQAALKDYNRAKELLKAGSMNQEQYDKVRFRYEDISVKMSWRSIAAPSAGTVLSVYKEPGEMVVPGTKLLTIADLQRLWAYVYVPASMIPGLSLGMTVKGFLPDSKMREIEGTILLINNEAEFTPKNVQTRKERTRLVYGVKIGFENNGGILKPGMTVEMKLAE